MGGGSVALAVAVIVGLCLFFLFIIPKGLTGITTQVIADDGVTFTNPAPTEKIEIIADCYSTKLQVNYKIDCTICTSKNINEYFWFKNSKDNEFTFLRGDRKTIFPNRDYSARTRAVPKAPAGSSAASGQKKRSGPTAPIGLPLPPGRD